MWISDRPGSETRLIQTFSDKRILRSLAIVLYTAMCATRWSALVVVMSGLQCITNCRLLWSRQTSAIPISYSRLLHYGVHSGSSTPLLTRPANKMPSAYRLPSVLTQHLILTL